ncbi:MAG: UDP-N-acetylglucosamine 2-epimerase (non-hydrolyzing) [Elusimicrobia bacterium]|nr:UDP-N-acetylglucosamine 2-epimerase (non-hydrolyzing) [Elusimicrobiota bacterium]
MARPNVLVVVGTRPEVVKMAPVVAALRLSARLRATVVGTAQHRGLMDQMLETFGLKLDYDLDLMRRDQTPAQVLSGTVERLAPVLRKEKPALVLVQGDTTTALGAALCSFYQRVPVGHVEAGLRSFDLTRPFPEEGNRVLIDRVADLMFAPTRESRANLLAEGLPARKISVTGNTVVDAVQWLLKRAPAGFPAPLRRFLACDGPKVIMTMHRRESFGAPMREVFAAVKRLLSEYPRLRLVYPVHPNPNVRGPAEKHLRHPRILLTPPMRYPAFIHTAKACDLILSDSGGVQEEAPSLGVPVVILREVTERPEVLRTGLAVLAGTDQARILRHARRFLAQGRRRAVRSPFGDGRAGQRIVKQILDSLD